MPSNELKQRKKGTNQGKQNEDPPETAKDGGDLAKKDARRLTCAAAPALDLRTVTCLVSLSVCLALTWFVLQQTTRFAEVEEKYKLLYRKTADIQGLENEIGKISRQLDSSEEDLQGALSSMSSVTKMEQDISSLHTVVNAMQDSERSVSHNIQNINRSFQNVTNVWKESLEVITQDIGNLKSDSKAAHNQITAKINEAEKNVKTIAEKLEDLEDSTRRNSRALERTENEDMERLEQHLKWNTKQVLKLEEEQQLLANKDRKLLEKITDYEPKAQQCEEHLPTVEHAVHSILRVSSDLVNTEKRIEDLTIQVFNMEDNMLKAISEILEIKQSLDALQVDNSILKLTNDLGVIKEMVKGFDGARQELPLEFENTQALMNKVKDHAVLTHIETLEQDIDRLKLWSSSLTEKREMLQENMTALSLAVEKIEQTTTSITKDVSVKVSAVKTDVRRMSGLESDVSALLSSTHKLEEKVKQAEKMMVQKIGDVLASSINRMMELKSSTEKNTEKIDFLKRKVAELKEEDDKLSQRLWTLESGRARLLKTVAFAGDLKPKVFVIRKDFALLEPRVSDLTLRIGRLASDLLQREQEIAVLKDSFTNLTLVKTDLQNVKQKLNEVPEVSDLFAQTKQPAE